MLKTIFKFLKLAVSIFDVINGYGEDGAEVEDVQNVITQLVEIGSYQFGRDIGDIDNYCWLIDTGHGLYTEGKRSPEFELNGEKKQLLEFEWVREVALLIADQLDDLGIDYRFTVSPDEKIGNFLAGRVSRANNNECYARIENKWIKKPYDKKAVFLSIHGNAGPSQSLNHFFPGKGGLETWYYNGSKFGEEGARVFQNFLAEEFPDWKNRGIKSKTKGQFYVLRRTKMNAILTENGFYNVKDQVIEMMNQVTKERIANAHVNAIRYCETNMIFG